VPDPQVMLGNLLIPGKEDDASQPCLWQTEDHEKFLFLFTKTIVMKDVYKPVCDKLGISQYLTGSLEAYAVLTYWNNYEAWIDKYHQNAGNEPSTTTAKRRFTEKNDGYGTCKGWPKEARELYNRILKRIRIQRADPAIRNGFEERVLEAMIGVEAVNKLKARDDDRDKDFEDMDDMNGPDEGMESAPRQRQRNRINSCKTSRREDEEEDENEEEEDDDKDEDEYDEGGSPRITNNRSNKENEHRATSSSSSEGSLEREHPCSTGRAAVSKRGGGSVGSATHQSNSTTTSNTSARGGGNTGTRASDGGTKRGRTANGNKHNGAAVLMVRGNTRQRTA
jgi:hypothetical protein